MGAQVVLIAGPTASGKSDLAIEMARENDGVIINADSMQVYDCLNIITARPNPQQLEQAKHLLYGHRLVKEPYSVAIWLREIEPVLQKLKEAGRAAIIVGGTGLYFKTLVEGLSPVPDIDPEIRTKWREFSGSQAGLHEALSGRDPEAAKQLLASDHQRIMRALEVFDSTGKSILYWQGLSSGKPLIEFEQSEKIILMPPRNLLHERINTRFDRMVDMGAVGEVEALLELNCDPRLPAMKAIGVSQISAYLKGQLSLDEALEKAKAASRQYAKRQSTWFNNQFRAHWRRI